MRKRLLNAGFLKRKNIQNARLSGLRKKEILIGLIYLRPSGKKTWKIWLKNGILRVKVCQERLKFLTER